MGTELMARGLNLPLPLWSAESNLTDPDVVQSVHHDYVNAGADIIGTNTFRTTTWSYRKAGFSPKRAAERAKSSLMKAVEMARSANPKIVAGSITSIEDCYEPEFFPGRGAAEDTYGENVDWFKEAGVDLILFETMGHLDEIDVAIQSVNENKIWLSMIVKNGKRYVNQGVLVVKREVVLKANQSKPKQIKQMLFLKSKPKQKKLLM